MREEDPFDDLANAVRFGSICMYLIFFYEPRGHSHFHLLNCWNRPSSDETNTIELYPPVQSFGGTE